MKTITRGLAKGTIAAVAAGAMAMGAVAPAQAQSQWRDHDRGGISAGEIIAGALIIGGIAAVASAASRDRGDRYDRYDRGGWDRAGNPRAAVEQCVYAAERNASRRAYRSGAKVTDIRNVDRKRDGYTVKGRIAVNTNNRDWRRGWNNDYRGWNNRYSGYDAGRFTCKVRNGRVVDIDYSGIRGL